MTPARGPVPTSGRERGVRRGVAEMRPAAVRPVPRPMYHTPPLRPSEPPRGPSHRDVLRQWEELEWWSCTYCGADFGPTVVAEVDHVRPLAHGGLHEWDNLVPACRDCNRSKSDADVTDWLASHLQW